MSDIPEKALDMFPPAYIILMLISGTILLLLSPIRFLLPHSISNPFTNSNPGDILSGFAVIAVCSFAIGIAFFLLEMHIIGNGGLNDNIRFVLQSVWSEVSQNGKHPRQVSEDISPKESDLNFSHWIKEKEYGGYYDFFVIQDHIVRGLILGFEVAFLSNIIILSIATYFVIPFVLLDLTMPFFGFFASTLIMLTISGSLFFLILGYEIKVWRKKYRSRIKPLFDAYDKEKKKTMIQERCLNLPVEDSSAPK
jgi:hypothetical protein